MNQKKLQSPEFIQISESGIKFPRELMNQLVDGRVVFVCGAGVSMPTLPSFDELTQQIFTECGFGSNENENNLIEDGRHEEALESLKEPRKKTTISAALRFWC
ncbi:MAG: hypothetical protein ORO03_02685 [Alphaproteobacteria bacterium]|nr:hypothetical protein [Alphaproteobacteria bacterium]